MPVVSNNKTFDGFNYVMAMEHITQNVELFQEKSGGAIVILAGDNVGDFHHTAFWKSFGSSAVNYRDPRSDSDVTPINLDQEDAVSARIFKRLGPVNLPDVQFTFINESPEEAAVMVGEEFTGPQMMRDFLNTAITAVTAAVQSNSDMTVDATADKLGQASLAAGRRKFGDRGFAIRSWIMHSKALWDLYDGSLGDLKTLFKYTDIGLSVITDPLGTIYFQTDSDALVVPGDTDQYLTLGMMPGAVVLEANGGVRTKIAPVVAKENIGDLIQMEYDINVSVKGYAAASGTPINSEAALATPANWSKVASDNKNTAAVVIKTK